MPITFLRRKWAMYTSKKIFEVFIFLAKFLCGIHIKFEGRENVPKEKNFILASKHSSIMETFIFAIYFNIPVYIVKRSLLFIPVFGWYMWRDGMVGIDRKGGKATIDKISDASVEIINNQKRTLIIFPQGTRTPADSTYSLQKYPYKKGILAMCAKLPEVKVLLATHNAVKFFGKGLFSLKQPGVVIVKFLPPIQMTNKLMNKPELNFLQEIQDKIETETNKII